MSEKSRIIIFSASLRNARTLKGAEQLVRDVRALDSKDALYEYLSEQGNVYLEQYFKAGRSEKLPFDQIYKNLKKVKGEQGLSNSEICAVAAMWGALQEKVTVKLVPLSHHFDEQGQASEAGSLKKLILEADGIIISTPVYFGDRSSLSQSLIDFIGGDPELMESMPGKIYGGVTVGAKRNGGQETTLIYQMYDMMNLGALGVGNDYITTSQYGGTGHAGDIGTMASDEYGLNTSIGTGRRVASVTNMMKMAQNHQLTTPVKIGFFALQDKNGLMMDMAQALLSPFDGQADIKIIRVHDEEIQPCLACDICPCRIGSDVEYRCMRGKKDAMHRLHEQLMDCDVIIAAALSPKNREGLVSKYQLFLERLRYLRRGDYALSNRLVLPLVFSEIGSNENLNMRMITSLIRHHTIMHRPVIGHYLDKKMLNKDDVATGLRSAVELGKMITKSHLLAAEVKQEAIVYKPIGFVLSASKDARDNILGKRQKYVFERIERMRKEFADRVSTPKSDSF